MSTRQRSTQTKRVLGVATVAIALTIGVTAQAPPPPQAFTTLASRYTQEIVGTTQLAPYPGSASIARVPW